jgi:CheY-like chemotaxis protein
VFVVKIPMLSEADTALATPTQRAKDPAVAATFSESGEPPPGADGRTQLRVLVVDDNLDMVKMLSSVLLYKGFGVRCAYSGPQGLAAAQQWHPDVVLLDIGLPGLDGYEVAKRLRADPALAAARAPGRPAMKLIALTGYGADSDIALAREAGFDGHLVKPCHIDELVAMIAAPVTRM